MSGRSNVRLCWSLSCGNPVNGRAKYCNECKKMARMRLADPSAQPEILVETLYERMAGDGPTLRLIRKYGTKKCLVCEENEVIPGRLYCCAVCRSKAQRGDVPKVVIDGIEATHIEHAKRVGMPLSTLAARLKRMTLEEALTTPIQTKYDARRRTDGDHDAAPTEMEL